MSQSTTGTRTLWGLTVLCLLRERPMHPYEMQCLIRDRKKDDSLDLKRGSLYHAIAKVLKARLIEAVETRREGKRPERTVYRLTAAGEKELLAWLHELVAQPVHEPTWFSAAIGSLIHLSPHEVVTALGDRARRIEAEITGLDETLRTMNPPVGRLLLIESEYRLASRQAELAWVRSLIADLQSGRLAWDPAPNLPRAGAAESVGAGSQVPVSHKKHTQSK